MKYVLTKQKVWLRYNKSRNRLRKDWLFIIDLQSTTCTIHFFCDGYHLLKRLNDNWVKIHFTRIRFFKRTGVWRNDIHFILTKIPSMSMWLCNPRTLPPPLPDGSPDVSPLDIVLPARPWSSLEPPPCGTSSEHLPRSASRRLWDRCSSNLRPSVWKGSGSTLSFPQRIGLLTVSLRECSAILQRKLFLTARILRVF